MKLAAKDSGWRESRPRETVGKTVSLYDSVRRFERRRDRAVLTGASPPYDLLGLGMVIPIADHPDEMPLCGGEVELLRPIILLGCVQATHVFTSKCTGRQRSKKHCDGHSK
jgi:hypothetical protein